MKTRIGIIHRESRALGWGGHIPTSLCHLDFCWIYCDGSLNRYQCFDLHILSSWLEQNFSQNQILTQTGGAVNLGELLPQVFVRAKSRGKSKARHWSSFGWSLRKIVAVFPRLQHRDSICSQAWCCSLKWVTRASPKPALGTRASSFWSILSVWDEDLLSRTATGTGIRHKSRCVQQHSCPISHQQSPSGFASVNLGLRLYLSSFPATPTHCSLGTGC